MEDRFGRPLRNLRLSVTDRFNLRCEYCMPEPDYVWLPREDLLRIEEMVRYSASSRQPPRRFAAPAIAAG